VIWLRRLALVGFGTFLGLALAEGGARLIWERPWYDELVSAQRDSETHAYTRNQWNLRDREYPVEKPPGRQRVLMVGDSFTFGQGVYDDAAIFPEILERRLSADPRFAPGVDILNGGLPGSLTDEWLRVWQATAEDFDPDLLLIVFFLRDGTRTASVPEFFDRIRDEVSSRNRRSRAYRYSYLYRLFRDARDREQVAKHYTERFRAAYFGPPHQTSEWRRAQANLLSLRDLAAARGTKVGFVVFPVLVQLDDDYPFREISQLIETFAKKNGFPTYNLLPDFMGRDATDYWVSGFDQHPNVQGHELVADRLEPFLSSLLTPPVP
jgi:hypothetical protein